LNMRYNTAQHHCRIALAAQERRDHIDSTVEHLYSVLTLDNGDGLPTTQSNLERRESRPCVSHLNTYAPVESNNGWRLEIGHDSAELTFDLELATISLPPSLCLCLPPSLPPGRSANYTTCLDNSRTLSKQVIRFHI
jgi:hypothetical protein